MFLQKLSNHLLVAKSAININSLRALSIAFGRTESELIDKWKQKLADENITEVEQSIKHILDHVVGKDKVAIGEKTNG